MAGPAAEAAVAEQSAFDVILIHPGQAKLQMVKVVKEITGLGLKEAKELVDAAPKAIKEKVSKAEAEQLKAQLEEAGGDVELK
jgi:large subunit ribosomal protein L7/L12